MTRDRQATDDRLCNGDHAASHDPAKDQLTLAARRVPLPSRASTALARPCFRHYPSWIQDGTRAAFDMAAQRRRSAAPDRRHDLELAEAHGIGMGRTPSRPAAAEDVRHLDHWP